MTIPAIFSILGTSFVIFSYFLFPKFQSQRHVQLVAFVAVNDLFASVGRSFGWSPSHGLCWFQSISSTFMLGSIFWSVVILYQLLVILIDRAPIQNLFYFHCFCWGMPLVLTLLSLFETLSDSSGGTDICFLANRIDSPGAIVVWEMVGFYIWLWLAVFVTLILFGLIVWHLWVSKSISLFFTQRLHRLGMYPLVFILCWFIPSCSTIQAAFTMGKVPGFCDTGSMDNDIDNSQSWCIVGLTLISSQGWLLALIFLYRNSDIYMAWRTLLFGASDDSSPFAAYQGPGSVTAEGENLSSNYLSSGQGQAADITVGTRSSASEVMSVVGLGSWSRSRRSSALGIDAGTPSSKSLLSLSLLSFSDFKAAPTPSSSSSTNKVIREGESGMRDVDKWDRKSEVQGGGGDGEGERFSRSGPQLRVQPDKVKKGGAAAGGQEGTGGSRRKSGAQSAQPSPSPSPSPSFSFSSFGFTGSSRVSFGVTLPPLLPTALRPVASSTSTVEPGATPVVSSSSFVAGTVVSPGSRLAPSYVPPHFVVPDDAL